MATRRDVVAGGASALVGALAWSRPFSARAAEGADIVIFGGPIVTMNDAAPTAEAVAVKDGVIVAVGPQSDVRNSWVGPQTRLIDLDGHALLPGFIDAHGHFMNAPRVVVWANLSLAPVGPVSAIPDIVKALQDNQAQRSIPKGEWVIGYGYDSSGLEEGRELTRMDLDAHFPDNPVMAIHVSNHGAVLNSSALDLFEITAETPTPEGGLIARLPGSNEPAGLLMETAFLPIFAQVPQPSEAELLDLLQPAQQIYASKGVTTAQEGATHAEELTFLRKAANEKRLYIDVVSLPFAAEVPKIFRSYLSTDNDGKIVAVGDASKEFGYYDNRLKLGGIKLVNDGSPQGKTAYWTKPLLTGGPAGEQEWVGQPVFPPELIAKLYKSLTEKNIQIWSHANGDAAIDMVIASADGAGVHAGDDRRHVVIHSQCMRPDQLDAYARIGLSPSFFTEHTYFWGDVHIENLGEDRAFFISPMKSAVAKGLRCSNHNDFMVTPVDPMLMVWSAMTRQSRSGVIVGPDERVDVMTALKAVTTTAAWQYREEDRKGSIEIGKLADLVILDRNPVTADVDDIPSIKVVETFKEGTTVYRASQRHGGLPGPIGPRLKAKATRSAFRADDGQGMALGCFCCGGFADLDTDEAAEAIALVTDSNLFA